jgi:hypothetical protein
LLSALAPPLVPTLELLYAYRPERITWSVLADFFGSDGSGDPPGLASLASFRSFPPKPPPAMFDSSPSANARRSRTARRAARTACSPASSVEQRRDRRAERRRAEPVRGLAEPLRVASPLLGKTRSGALRFLSEIALLSKPERRSLSPARGERRAHRLRREALRVGEEGAEHFLRENDVAVQRAHRAREVHGGGAGVGAGVEMAEIAEVSRFRFRGFDSRR